MQDHTSTYSIAKAIYNYVLRMGAKLYSQLSPCGHLAFKDTTLMRTVRDILRCVTHTSWCHVTLSCEFVGDLESFYSFDLELGLEKR